MPVTNLINTQETGYRFVPRVERGPLTLDEKIAQLRAEKAAREEANKPKPKRERINTDELIDFVKDLL